MASAIDIISIAANLATVGALLFTAFTYKDEQKKNRLQQEKIRQDTTLALIKESKKSEKIQLALNILDDYVIPPKHNWLHSGDIMYYHISNLQTILRSHMISPIEDPGEQEIRLAFDELFEFLNILNSYLSSGVLQKQNIRYFSYYLQKMKNNKPITDYMKLYGYDIMLGEFFKKLEV